MTTENRPTSTYNITKEGVLVPTECENGSQVFCVQSLVCSFYEKLALELFRAEHTKNRSDGDLTITYGGNSLAGLEVKGRGNTKSFGVHLRQLERHWSLASGFPYDAFFYALFSYRALEKRTEALGKFRRPLLSRRARDGRASEYLARNTTHLWVLPIQTIRRLAGDCDPRDDLFLDIERRKAFSIGRGLIRQIRGDTNLQQKLNLSVVGDGLQIRTSFVINRKRVGVSFRATIFSHAGEPTPQLREEFVI